MNRFLGSAAVVLAVAATGVAHAVPSPILTQFEGNNLRDFIAISGGFATTPPDMAGAVSATHVIQFTNGGVSIYDKSGTLLSYQTTDQFVAGTGIPADQVAGGPFDPRLTYDPATKRFFGVFENRGPAGPGLAPNPGRDFPKLGESGEVEPPPQAVRLGSNGEGTEIDAPSPNRNNPIFILVSNTSNPLDGFKAVQFNTTQGNFGDFPTLGVSHNAVTITTNDFDATSLQSVSIFTLPKKDLLKATPTAANLVKLEGIDPAAAGFALQAVNNRNSYKGRFAGIESQKLLGISATAYNEVNATDIAFNSQGQFIGGALEGPITIAYDGDTQGGRQPIDVRALRPFDPANRPHPLVDSGGDRIGSSIYQTGNYVFSTHTFSESQNGSPAISNQIEWLVTDARDNSVVTEGKITNPDIDFAYSAIAPTRFGTKFLLAYIGSGVNQVLSAYASICSFSAAAGTSSCGAPILLREGLDPGFILTFNGDRNRYGDYSQAQWDESTNSWWLFQEYPGLRNPDSPFFSPNSGRWNTVITQIGLGSPVPEPAALALFGLGVGGLMLRRRRAV